MKLAKYSKKELVELEAKYHRAGKYKTCDEIRREITSRIAEERKAKGDNSWLMEAGYTGRNSNRR